MRVLVTGGAGFVGSHAVVELISAGHEVVIVDNLVNAKSSVVSRIAQITGSFPEFHNIDIRDAEALERLVDGRGFEAVMHFAALKAVGESVADPLRYYDNNVSGTIALLEVLNRQRIRSFVFSSSATVYGDAKVLPVTEDQAVGTAANPYGSTKIMMEQVLADLHRADPSWNVAVLRYFNPVGAHPSGLIGEDPSGVPTNLMPYVAQVADRKLPYLRVFGTDYPTRDGTGIRDYVHVSDVGTGHVLALEALRADPGLLVYNLGTGEGTSVLEVVAAFEQASGREVPMRRLERRPGDVAATWADVSKAERELGWKAVRGLADMCVDAWRWQENSRLTVDS